MTISTEHEATAVPARTAAAEPLSAGKVIETTAAHIEPVTRFDRSDLAEVEPEVERFADVTVTLSQTAHFRIATHRVTGRLPEGPDAFENRGEMEQELSARLAQVESEAPQALQRWADENPGTYRRLLPGHAAFLTRPNRVGHESVCDDCHGECSIVCDGCRGQQKLPCGTCGRTGYVRCGNCSGTMRTFCYACSGTGQIVSSGVQDGRSVTEYRYCNSCGGRGHQDCYSCARGWVGCGSCGTEGWITCSTCRGRGRVDCSPCEATGWFHEIGYIDSSVGLDEGKPRTNLDDPRAESLLANVDLDALPRYGQLQHVSHTVAGCTLQTVHSLKIAVQRAHIQAAGETFELHGFGPHAEVLEFCNIAGRLLQADLDELVKATQATRGLRRRQDDALLPALSVFLQSELNMLIAEAAETGDVDVANKAVQEKYKGLVSRAYVESALVSLRTALRKVYGAEVAEPALYLAGVAALAGLILSWYQWPNSEWTLSAVLTFGGAALAWWATEAMTERRISRPFDKKMADRVLAQARTEGSVGRWRTRALCAVAAAAAIGAFVPWKFMHAERLASAAAAAPKTANAAWSRWQAQSVDISLRDFGDRASLERWTTQGHASAATMLAWGYALGADGWSKDLYQARRFVAMVHGTREAKVIQAVMTLNEDSRPADIIRAAADLEEAEKGGSIEASYWLARTQLAQQGPVFNPGRGVERLRKAAERGHGHAAFVLGRIYAEGRSGQARDLALAQRYLKQASQAGVAEAAALLAKL